MKQFKSMSRRTLSLVSAIAVFLTMILAVVSGFVFVSLAGNPAGVTGLNTSSIVEEINMLPVAPATDGNFNADNARTFFNKTTDTTIESTTTKFGYIRDGLNSMDVKVNEDGSVRLTAKKTYGFSEMGVNAGNTMYDQCFTYINQKVSLAETPWLMMQFSGTARAGGRIYFTVTCGGKTYGGGTQGTTDSSVTELTNYDSLSVENKFKRSIPIPWQSIAKGVGATSASDDTTNNDFDSNISHDYSIDFFGYLYDKLVVGKSETSLNSLDKIWPSDPAAWEDFDNYYITIVGVSTSIVTEADHDFEAGKYVEWKKLAMGREVMDQPVSILPRCQDMVSIENGSLDGRVSSLDDGTYSFANSSSSPLTFSWDVRRYFNVAEFDSLHVKASFSGANYTDIFNGMVFDFGGKNLTYTNGKAYTYQSIEKATNPPKLDNLVQYCNGGVDIRDNATGTYEAVADFAEYVRRKVEDTSIRFVVPDDKVLYVGTITLTLPAGAKVTFSQLEFMMTDDTMAATKSDSAYPWAAGEAPATKPPHGTPASSTLLNDTSGVAYDWAVTVDNAPVTKHKVDLLALKNISFNRYDVNIIEGNQSYGESAKVIDSKYYQILPSGESVFTTDEYTDYAFHRLMRQYPYQYNNDTSDNYYLYLDVTKSTSSSASSTPYLYYSYTIEDLDTDDGVEAAAGFYFHFANSTDTYVNSSNETKPVYFYYLDQSGMALNQCPSLFTDTSDLQAAKVLVSTEENRNGCIDLSGMRKDGGLLAFEECRVYLAPNTKLTMHYFFVGGGTLSESVEDVVATQGGLAFPWNFTKDEFDAATDPDSSESQITFANKLDLLMALNDRGIVNNKGGIPNATILTEEEAQKYGVSAESVKVTVDDTSALTTGYKTSAGVSFDHYMRVLVASATDLTSLRYLNYSVTAPAGMRWSLVLSDNSSGDRAVLSWSDHKAFFSDGNSDGLSAAGLPYFRYFTSDEYSAWAADHNTSWRIFAVPGSQSGCIDLQQCAENFSWSGGILSMYLVAYRDPSMVLTDEVTEASVIFDYMYLTSEPIAKDGVGNQAVSAGTVYSWGSTEVAPPSVTSGSAFTPSGSIFKGVDDQYEVVEYKPSNPTVTYSSTPNFYYSYRLVKKDGSGDLGRVGMAIVENVGTTQYHHFRNTFGNSTKGVAGLAKPAFLKMNLSSDTSLFSKEILVDQTESGDVNEKIIRPQMYTYGSETGCVELSGVCEAATSATVSAVQFYIDRAAYPADQYELIVDYLYVGASATASKSFTKSANFSFETVMSPSDYRVHFAGLADTEIAAGAPTTYAFTVDLTKTPYLYYSLRYDAGESGTFSIETDRSVLNGSASSTSFFRDPTRKDQLLISAGVPSGSDKYVQQSETGCINLYQWYLTNGHAVDTVTIHSITFWGSNPYVEYMFFAPDADKTIDLIPSQASGSLESGTPTIAWVYEHNGSYGELQPSEDGWDIYKSGTTNGTPSYMKVDYVKKAEGDEFNNLKYYNENYWSYTEICYGQIVKKQNGTFDHITSGNSQTAGLTINLNETPYLHFSFSQPETSQTSLLLQINNATTGEEVRNQSADKMRPWQSLYLPTSSAGQLAVNFSNTNGLAHYKDIVMNQEPGVKISGNFAGVIDLRAWFTETNGCDNIINLERIRLYTHEDLDENAATEVTVNHLYLSSSAASAYNVTFNKNDAGDDSQTYTQSVLVNANAQYASDASVESFKTREGYYFTGWYSDAACEKYFDIYNTPITADTILYAGWLNADCVVDSNEVHFLDSSTIQSAIPVGEWNGELTQADDGGMTIKANDTSTVQIRVNKAYKLRDLRSLYLGFDTDTTTSDIRMMLTFRSVGTHSCELLSQAFDLKDMMTAGPYDVEIPFYLYLSTNDLLPAAESKEGYIQIESFSVTVPQNTQFHLRYAKAAAESPDESDLQLIAPNIKNAHDLLDAHGDEAFVIGDEYVLYQETEKTPSYIAKDENNKDVDVYYSAASIGSMKEGYIHLGNLYDYSIDVDGTSDENQYLYYSITQPEGSSITFAVYAAFDGDYKTIEAGTDEEKKYPLQNQFTEYSVMYFTTGGTLKCHDEITTPPYVTDTTVSGVLDLKSYYVKALKSLRSNAVTRDARILGIRFFTSDATDADINYLILGGADTTSSLGDFSMHINYKPMWDGISMTDAGYKEFAYEAQLTYKNGDQFFHKGDTVTVSLDDLSKLVDKYGNPYEVSEVNDPTKVFVGWFFRDAMYVDVNNTSAPYYEYGADSLVYWNPYAKNGRELTATNPEGSWTLNETLALQYGLITNMREVTYTFDTRSNTNTQIISPVWESADYAPLLSVTLSGESGGAVSLATENGAVAGQQNQWNVPFGNQVVLRATPADGYAFVGWYDTHTGQLVSSAQDYAVSMFADVELEAKFDVSTNVTLQDPTIIDTGFRVPSSSSNIWLQSNNSQNFTLRSQNNHGSVYAADGQTAVSPVYSGYASVGGSDVQCYWNVQNGQVVTAVANDSSCHWEQVLQDGTRIRVSEGQEYTFVVSESIKLLCVNEASAVTSSNTTAIVNEYAAHTSAFDTAPDTKRFTAQFLPMTDGETIVACGIVAMDARCTADLPYVESGDSTVYYASAWNSTTGQYTVEFTVDEDGGIYRVRPFAIVKFADGTYTIRYGDTVATVV